MRRLRALLPASLAIPGCTSLRKRSAALKVFFNNFSKSGYRGDSQAQKSHATIRQERNYFLHGIGSFSGADWAGDLDYAVPADHVGRTRLGFCIFRGGHHGRGAREGAQGHLCKRLFKRTLNRQLR